MGQRQDTYKNLELVVHVSGDGRHVASVFASRYDRGRGHRRQLARASFSSDLPLHDEGRCIELLALAIEYIHEHPDRTWP